MGYSGFCSIQDGIFESFCHQDFHLFLFLVLGLRAGSGSAGIACIGVCTIGYPVFLEVRLRTFRKALINRSPCPLLNVDFELDQLIVGDADRDARLALDATLELAIWR